jgi:hypothetical protein
VAVVSRFRDLPEAETASATLRAAGIQNAVTDAHTIGLLWTYSVALGWIRLRVRGQDLEAARELLESAVVIEPPEIGPEAEPDEICPKCGSTDLALVKGSRKTVALLLLTQIAPVWFWRPRLICRGCWCSRVVPTRFRPELFFAMLAAALLAIAALVIVYFVVGTFISQSSPHYYNAY